nr:pentatricopeptide repeat protein AaPPR1085 [Agave angustifolia]
MFKLGHFCRLSTEINNGTLSYLSSACQMLDEMPRRKDSSSKRIPSQFTNPKLDAKQTGKDSSLSVQTLLELAALSCVKFVRVIINCIVGNGILTGREVHCLITKCGFSSNPFISSSLIDMYSKCGLVEEARTLFDEIASKDLVLWNVMISCCSMNGLGKEALGVFKSMRVSGFIGDGFTFSSLLSSCSLLGCSSLGEQTHGLVMRLGLDLDVVLGTALVDMYMKCGHIEYARRAFSVMNHSSIIFWNAIITGYGQHGDGKEAMKLFAQMIRRDLKPDELTFASVLSSCANLAMANEATQVHNCVVKSGFQSFLSSGNALIMAYAKSGSISNALRCFQSLTKPDLISWTSIIASYAFHGLAEEAIVMFERMLIEGVNPDKVAFVGVLSACSHAGLVERGLHYFTSMKTEHRIEPSSEHYTCLVDLLGRSGHLTEACNVMANMPFEPGGDVLGAFIGACKVHGNTEFAKLAAERLFSVEPDESMNYKLMSNIYAASGCWDDVARVRKLMRDNCGDEAPPGCSWIECGGRVHTFVSNDESHCRASEMYCMLHTLLSLMKDEDL